RVGSGTLTPSLSFFGRELSVVFLSFSGRVFFGGFSGLLSRSAGFLSCFSLPSLSRCLFLTRTVFSFRVFFVGSVSRFDARGFSFFFLAEGSPTSPRICRPKKAITTAVMPRTQPPMRIPFHQPPPLRRREGTRAASRSVPPCVPSWENRN